MLFDRSLLRLGWEQRKYFGLAALFAIAGGALSLWQARYFSLIVSRVFLGGETLTRLFPLFGLLFSVLLLRAFFMGGQDYFSTIGSYQLKKNVRARLIAMLPQNINMNVGGESAGTIPSVIFDSVDALESYFGQYIPQVIQAGVMPPIFLIAVIAIDPLSGVVFLLTGPLIPFFMRLIGEAAQHQTERQWERLSQLSDFLLGALQGLPMIKRLGISQDFVNRLKERGVEYRNATMQVLKISFLSALVLEMLTTLSTAIVAVQVGLRLLYGWITLEQALFVLFIAPDFYLPLRLLGQKFHSGISGLTGGKRVLSWLEREQNNKNFLVEPEVGSSEVDIPTMIRKAGAALRFVDVQASYVDRGIIVERVNFCLKAGEISAIVGESGAGKSTLSRLVLGFFQPSQGTILLGDIPIDSIPRQVWWKNIGWIAQTPYIFHGTIWENICFGHSEVAVEKVEKAAEMANILDFIRSLPDGFETVIGEGGIGLSAGQAQRLALARAYLKDASILVWDEGGAHLDPENLEIILQSLSAHRAGRVILIISHQPQTIAFAQHVIQLDEFRPVKAMNQNGDKKYPDQASDQFDSGFITTFPLIPAKTNSVTGSLMGVVFPEFDSVEIEGGKSERLGGQILFRLFGFLSPLKKWVALATLLGIAAVFSNIGLMYTSAYIITFASLAPSIALLQVAIVGVRFFGISRGVWRYLERLTTHRVTLDLLTRLRVRLYTLLEPRTPEFFLRYSSGEVLSRLMADIASLEPFYVRCVAPFLSAAVVGLGMTLGMMYLLPRYAGILAVIYLFAGIGLPVIYSWITNNGGSNQSKIRGEATDQIIRMVQGMEELFVNRTYHLARQKLMTSLDQYDKAQRSYGLTFSSHTFLMNVLAYLALGSCLAAAVISVGKGEFNAVNLAGIALAVLVSFEAFMGLPHAAQIMVNSREAAKRLLDLPKTVPVQVEKGKEIYKEDAASVAFRGVTFTYPVYTKQNGAESVYRHSKPAVDDIWLDLPAGKRVGIVGPSGAGKTTLIHLLLGFYPPDKGEIIVNQHRLTNLNLVEWRQRVASCAQGDFLFHTTIEENLRLLAPQAGNDTMEAVLQAVDFDPVLRRLPGGIKTVVGERGQMLSGGERKRLLIARTLLRPSPLYIFDEPLAELDQKTAMQVIAGILAWTEGKTLLIISHFPWGLDLLDEILVMEEGKITQRGSHALLIEQEGYYSRLWQPDESPKKNINLQ
ncbi:MAG: thiol reductant ABC exporter subunit CydD [Chloroflexota bacterium]